MHPLLERQLRKLGIAPEATQLAPTEWQAVCERISRAYATADQERYLLERSLNLASQEMRELHEDLQEAAEQRYMQLLESMNDAVFTVGFDGQITSVNRACEDLTGYRRDELVGRDWRVLVEADERVPERTAEEVAQRLDGARNEIELLASDGSRIPLEISTRVIRRDGAPSEMLNVGRDIRERREHEERLAYLATHDALTGLPNRTVLEEALHAAIAAAAEGEPAVLALLDIDNFKLVNDTFGHTAGDQVLVTLASLLGATVPDALVVRLSGDEFAMLMRGCDISGALPMAERVRQLIEQADVSAAGERVFLAASIGLVPVSPSSDPGGLLAEADAAMYVAKDGGRNRIFWSGRQDAITGGLAESYRWSAKIRTALESRGFEIHYQPIVSLDDEQVGHYEALVRLRAEDGTLVAPGTFIPVAERFGLMPAIDRYVINEVLDHLRRYPPLRVFVNLSAMTLADRVLLRELVSTLEGERALGRRLGLEITETAVLRDVTLAQHWMQELQRFGCEFALDDFGTGFNSLTYARLLPVNQIKIDGSFVRAISSDPKQRAVAAAVKVLADGLGMETVAECIETPEALAVVQALGITYGQGYLLGRPSREIGMPLRRVA